MSTHAAELGTLNSSASRQDLDRVETTLSDLARAQTGSKNGSSAAVANLEVARNALLLKYLRPISAIARAKLGQSTDFAALKPPKSTRSVPRLVAAARAMGDVVAQHADTFIAAGMAPTLLADLEAAADAVIAAKVLTGSTNASRVGATSALDVITKEARKLLKQLDSLVVPLLAHDPALLVQWKATKRLSGRTPGISTAIADAAVP